MDGGIALRLQSRVDGPPPLSFAFGPDCNVTRREQNGPQWRFWIALSTAAFLFYAFTVSGGWSITPRELLRMDLSVLAAGVGLVFIFAVCLFYCGRVALRRRS